MNASLANILAARRLPALGIFLATMILSIPAFAVLSMPDGVCVDSPNGGACSSKVGKYPSAVDPMNFHPGHYVIATSKYMDQIRNKPPGWLVNENIFKGLRVLYEWKDLEVGDGVYDFSAIDRHLKFAKKHGLQIFLFVRYMSHGTAVGTKPKTPTYMWKDPKYGCDPKFYGTYKKFTKGVGSKQVWYPCFHNKNVAEKRHALYRALGKRYNDDPNIEGLQIDETSVCPDCGAQYGLTVDKLRIAFEDAALAAKQAFPSKSVIQKITAARYDLVAFAKFLADNNIGIGSTDIYIVKSNRGTSMYNYSYAAMKRYHDVIPTFPEVQMGSFKKHNKKPNPGDRNLAESILKAAIRETNPWYMAWVRQEPYFTEQVLPILREYGQLPAAAQFQGQ